MRGRKFLLVSSLCLQLASMPTSFGSAATSLLTCAPLPTESERSDCVDQRLAEFPGGELAALREVVEELPAAVLDVAVRRADPPGAEPARGAVRAAWLDLQGEALSELGRSDEAAEKFAESVSLDDGTLRLTWISPEHGERWRAPLDPGDGRLERAARSLIEAGRSAEARALLGRALDLGADGWMEQAWLDGGGGDVPGRSDPPQRLRARDWFKPVPDLEVELAEGGSFSLRRDSRGRVMILSFWATWCQPCLRELPRLQQLYESERERGLEVVAINAGESMKVALPFARSLELTFPIASGSSELHKVFDTARLPLTAVVDRWGSVRGRWAGYEPGDDERLAAMTRRLLAEESPPAREVAEVSFGHGLLGIEWMRPAPGSVEGLAVVPRGAGAASVLVSSSRSLALYDKEGQTEETWTTPAPLGQLRVSPAAPDGRVEALAFRAGGTALVSVDLPSGERREWSAPAAVFDAGVAGPPGPDAEAPVLLATMRGLYRRPPGGAAAEPVATFPDGASALVLLGGEPARGSVALDFGGRLTWLGPGLEREHQSAAPAGSWVLVGSGEGAGVGVAPSSVVAAAAGRFLDRPGRQAALATASGQFVLLDLRTGETLFRARWEGITALAAGNLLGDPKDELVIGAGANLGVLRVLDD